MKGGGSGGGYAQVVPTEDINLHLTGDAHAVAASHNLLSAFHDNHLFHGNPLSIDPEQVTWPRTVSMNDRGLREIVLGEDTGGRRVQFVITEASEVMAVLVLAKDPLDLQQRLARMLVGLTKSGDPVTANRLIVSGRWPLS